MVNKRVLIVEDEFIIAHNLARELAYHHVDTVAFAPSVDRAFEISNRNADFDGAVLDIRLPGGDVFPFATMLHGLGKAMVFFTGASGTRIPAELRAVPVIGKLGSARSIAEALFGPGAPPTQSSAGAVTSRLL